MRNVARPPHANCRTRERRRRRGGGDAVRLCGGLVEARRGAGNCERRIAGLLRHFSARSLLQDGRRRVVGRRDGFLGERAVQKNRRS